ncbi:hypothetical protein AVEN_136663-1 [Araneus ventricosus]|uniref:Uncharacterized protein n=1 Tax=Araneus ventricosus TaxID=182803 RepID=A0A4Y2UVC3_ARAVE|nr:hypothetical protein AVEN_136663-1 [Araneus ventricosus]
MFPGPRLDQVHDTMSRSNNSTSPLTTSKKQLQFQTRYHMGRSLTLPLCLLVIAGNNGVAFKPWVALPGEITPDVHHPLLPGTPLATMKPLTGCKEGQFTKLEPQKHLLIFVLFDYNSVDKLYGNTALPRTKSNTMVAATGVRLYET